MKKKSLFLALTPISMCVIPQLTTHFGKSLLKVRKNVFNVRSLDKKDIEDYMEYLRIPKGAYEVGIGEVSKWPFSVKISNVMSEKDISECPYCGRKMKYAVLDKKAGFIKTLILGALKSLKVASALSFNFGLIKIVKILEDWVKSNYK